MNLLTQNAKMKKTSKENKTKIFNFSIPAYKTKQGKITCPFAKECVKYCYAQKGNYTRFPIIQQLMEKKYNLTKQDNFIELITNEIKKKKANYIRIHDSGDFYSVAYLKKWVQIAKQNKDVIFYAYTKSIKFFIDYQINLPKNMKIIFSEGSKTDNLINTKKHRHARIFKTVTDLLKAGYIDASNNDLKAITDNKKVGLVYH
jgi:DNA repair photolyase|tara:strand:+ start:286 stop:891 length:606 start_codon:yes stop_codon:yes gene_type:complete